MMMYKNGIEKIYLTTLIVHIYIIICIIIIYIYIYIYIWTIMINTLSTKKNI
jgi:hypothetical protein